MSVYRFHLQKYQRGSKTICPQCERKACFTRYVDEQQEVTFPEYVGKCDHENSCGYHYTHREFFQDNPDKNIKEEWYSEYPKSYKAVIKQVTDCTLSFIPNEYFKASLSHYDMNPFYKYLCSVFGEAGTKRVFQLYHIGTAAKWGGSTVFWQVDSDDRVRSGKIILYDSKTGHRVKEPYPYIGWAHSELKIKDFNLKQCLFGEHLLNKYPDASVILVESEKTAVVMSHFIPNYVWLATGGINGCFKEEYVHILKDRDVTLIPDLGAYEVWKEKSKILSKICRRVIVSDMLEQIATEEERSKGLDISDYYLYSPSKHQILQMMIEKNPVLQDLIDDLDLELVDAYQLPETPQIVQDNENEGTCSGS